MVGHPLNASIWSVPSIRSQSRGSCVPESEELAIVRDANGKPMKQYWQNGVLKVRDELCLFLDSLWSVTVFLKLNVTSDLIDRST